MSTLQPTGHGFPRLIWNLQDNGGKAPGVAAPPRGHASCYLPDDQESYTNLAATASSTAIPGRTETGSLFVRTAFPGAALSVVLTATRASGPCPGSAAQRVCGGQAPARNVMPSKKRPPTDFQCHPRFGSGSGAFSAGPMVAAEACAVGSAS